MTADTVRITEIIRAAPATVSRYLEDAALMGRWLDADVTFEPSAGSDYRIAFHGSRVVVGGTVREVLARRRLVLGWGIVSGPGAERMPPDATVVTIELEAHAEGTRLTLTHAGLPREDVPDHEGGWREYATSLRTLAETPAPHGGDIGTARA